MIIKIVNKGTTKISVVLEPWALETELAGAETKTWNLRDPPIDQLELHVGDDVVSVFLPGDVVPV
jgi:hypothetical protein